MSFSGCVDSDQQSEIGSKADVDVRNEREQKTFPKIIDKRKHENSASLRRPVPGQPNTLHMNASTFTCSVSNLSSLLNQRW